MASVDSAQSVSNSRDTSQAADLNTRVLQHILKNLDTLLAQVKELMETQKRHETRLTKLEEAQENIPSSTLTDMKTELSRNYEEIKELKRANCELLEDKNYEKQLRIDNDICVSGLPERADSNAITNQICKIYDINPANVNYNYAFSIKNKNERENHFVVIGLTNRRIKSELIHKKIQYGALHYQQISPQLKNTYFAEKEIFIGHRLTPQNLSLQKKTSKL